MLSENQTASLNYTLTQINPSNNVYATCIVGACDDVLSFTLKGMYFVIIFNIPGECRSALGMEEGRIPDTAITASSSYEAKSVGPQNAR